MCNQHSRRRPVRDGIDEVLLSNLHGTLRILRLACERSLLDQQQALVGSP